MQPLIKLDEVTGTLSIQGTLPLSDYHTLQAVELTLSYWPDRHDQSACAQIVLKENNIRSSTGGSQ
jgi:hypothetical protein